MNVWVQDMIFTAQGSDLYARHPQGDDIAVYMGGQTINAMTAIRSPARFHRTGGLGWWKVIAVGDDGLMIVTGMDLLPRVITPPAMAGKHDFIAVKAGASRYAEYAVAVLERKDRAMYVGHYDLHWNLDPAFVIKEKDAWINWVATHFLHDV